MIPIRFTQEKIANIQQDITQAEFKARFGEPDEVRITTCQGKDGIAWTCEIWKYRDANSPDNQYMNHTIWWQVHGTSRVLNGYDIRAEGKKYR